MSNDIKVGDLVMRIRPSECGCTIGIGRPFIAAKIMYEDNIIRSCGLCGNIRNRTGYVVYDEENISFPSMSRLIKIDHPPITEDITNEQEITI